MHGTRRFVITFAALFVLVFAASVAATPLLEVQVPDREAFNQVRSGGFDIIPGPRGLDEGVLYVVGWPQDIPELEQRALSFRVFIEDIEAYYAAQLDNELDDMGGYPTYDEVQAWLDEFSAAHPDLVSGPTNVGWTFEGREVDVVKISDNPGVDEDEPEVFINGLIHAREPVTVITIQNFAEMLVEEYGSDPRITELVDNREIYLMPIINADGYVYNEQIAPDGGGMHRKNMRPPDGVDLNRNFPYMWGIDNEGSSPDPYDQTYRGPAPASEPETMVAIDFINSREFAAVLNYHTYSNLILTPWGYTYERPPNYDVYYEWGQYMNETLDWEVGGPEIIYLTNGGAQDWQAAGDPDEPASADYHMWAYTFEIGSWWQGGFWPDIDTGWQLAYEQEEPLLRFCEVAENPLVLLPPVAPVMTVDSPSFSPVNITWTHDDPNGNDAVSFDVAEFGGFVSEDDAEDGSFTGWEIDGFFRTTQRSHSGTHSYYSGSDNNLNRTMTTMFPIDVADGDELNFWTWYDIEDDYDYAYVLVSTDGGGTFATIPGNITTEDDPHGVNWGHGITGDSNGWTFAEFPLDEFAGEQIFVRFAYVTDTYVDDDGFFFDDVTPIVGFGEMTTLASGIEQMSYLQDYGVVDEEFTTWFSARATDAGDETGPWAPPAEVLVQPGEAQAILDLTGINTNVGPNGGTISYSVSLQTFVPIPFPGANYWTMVTAPGGNTIGPLSQVTFTVPPNADITVDEMLVNVPALAPAGQYTFTGNAGYYPNALLSDDFLFTKTLNGPGQDEMSAGWSETGWPSELAGDAAPAQAPLPDQFTVSQAYPNPFNPAANVTVALPEASVLTVRVYNVSGRQVAELANGPVEAGRHTLTFDGSPLASGVYFIHTNVPGELDDVQKVTLLK